MQLNDLDMLDYVETYVKDAEAHLLHKPPLRHTAISALGKARLVIDVYRKGLEYSRAQPHTR